MTWADIKTVVDGQAEGGTFVLSPTCTTSPEAAWTANQEITIGRGSNVTIWGSGCTIDAGKQGRFFTVQDGGALALHNLNLTNGHGDDDDGGGGALYVTGGACTISSSTVSNNQAVSAVAPHTLYAALAHSPVLMWCTCLWPSTHSQLCCSGCMPQMCHV
jgi:pectate lyase